MKAASVVTEYSVQSYLLYHSTQLHNNMLQMHECVLLLHEYANMFVLRCHNFFSMVLSV